MKNSAKLLLLSAVLGALALPAISVAQDTPPPAAPADGAPPPPRGGRGRMSPEARVALLDKALTLTADQKTQITALLQKQADAMKDLSPEDRRAKMQSSNKETNDAIRALLTDDQKTKFDAMPRPGAGGPPRNGGDVPPPKP